MILSPYMNVMLPIQSTNMTLICSEFDDRIIYSPLVTDLFNIIQSNALRTRIGHIYKIDWLFLFVDTLQAS